MSSLLKIYVPGFIVVYFTAALFLKSYIQYKRTGVNPVTFGKRSESAHDYVGLWFKLVLVAISLHCFIFSFYTLEVIDFADTLYFKAIGIALTLGSLIFTIYAQGQMGNSWRVGIDEEVKTELVSSGPFAYTRNPIFLAMLVTLFGLLLLMPTLTMVFLFALSYLLINLQVRLEEEYLLKVHGEKYTLYKKTVGRFLPKWVETKGVRKMFCILLVFLISLYYLYSIGIIYPLKIVEVDARIVEVNNRASYSENGVDEVFFVETMLEYEIKVENLERRSLFARDRGLYKFRIEPKNKLKISLKESIFDNVGFGSSSDGKSEEIGLSYLIGSVDPAGKHPSQLPPSDEGLKEVKNNLYDADLVIEFDDKEIKRVNLLDYKKEK